jgi:hypothetical protein
MLEASLNYSNTTYVPAYVKIYYSKNFSSTEINGVGEILDIRTVSTEGNCRKYCIVQGKYPERIMHLIYAQLFLKTSEIPAVASVGVDEKRFKLKTSLKAQSENKTIALLAKGLYRVKIPADNMGNGNIQDITNEYFDDVLMFVLAFPKCVPQIDINRILP